MRRILVATDGSPSSVEAVSFGAELAAEHEAELMFVHVIPMADADSIIGYRRGGGAIPNEPTAVDRSLLKDAVAVASERALVSTTALLSGDTVDEIVAYADSHDVDLIVIGSRGHGVVAGTLLGSISRGVLGESKRPVMIVRAAPRAVTS